MTERRIEMAKTVLSEEVKTRLFKQMLRLEKLGEVVTYDGRDYVEQSEGAYLMLMILGISSEYIDWAYGK